MPNLPSVMSCAPQTPFTKAVPMHVCVFSCGQSHDDATDAILHGLQHLADGQESTQRDVRTLIMKEDQMSVDIETLAADFATYKNDVTAKFAALLAAIAAEGSGRIPTAVQTEIDALDASINGADADANAVVVPADPSDPTIPVDPGTPADPTDPTDPSAPTDPATPADPTDTGTDGSTDAPVDAPAAA
jgi:hypothetical protein